ncbi:MAG: dipeptidase [Planctomycetota bacterium]
MLPKTIGPLLVLCIVLTGIRSYIAACTTIMAGRQATADGSVLMSSSCDGNQMGHMCLMPAQEYASDERVAMLRDDKEVGEHLPPLEKTYRCVILGDGALGGMNEHGVSIGIEYIPMRDGLASTNGLVSPYSSHWTTSLIANGLMRAKTAREAVRLIGAMVEEHGFLYTWAPLAGVALPIADRNEIWLLEIFGPEENWSAQSETPGGVWCAQRIPDDAVGVSANRSRIGRVDLDDCEHFMASPNVFSLAKRLGFWEEGKPFVWSDVYGGSGARGNVLREWRALSLVAPSENLTTSGDPDTDRYPFSVNPDRPVTVETLIELMRDGYEGTDFDITARSAFRVEGTKSPLARTSGPRELFDLLDIEPERTINTPASTYVFVAQARASVPAPIGNQLWFAYGPAHTSCFVPIYPAVRELPASWVNPPNFAEIDRGQVQWNYRLVSNLANQRRYQDIIKDVRQVIQPAEAAFLDAQSELDSAALQVLEREGRAGLERFLTDYVHGCLTEVETAYRDLVDYLMFQYLYDRADIAPAQLPTIERPVIPGRGPGAAR